MRITFLHPDLGIGGAERLVVDAALALRSKGHDVHFVTNHFSEKHCFQETLSFCPEGVKVIGGFPRSISGRCIALCAYVRICIAALYICLREDPDVIFCDLISAPLALLRLFGSAKLVFYCHYPDQLLTRRESTAKRLYRFVLDNIESWTTGMADLIFVNSRFTESVFRSTFSSLASRKLEVLYPSLNTHFFDQHTGESNGSGGKSLAALLDCPPMVEPLHTFLSINRFERKKNIELAVEAFAQLRHLLNAEEFKQCLLVLAGGYDPLNEENIVYHHELRELVGKRGLDDAVYFCLSPDDARKIQLLQRCSVVLYTPKNEHFGIVPIEAMYLSRPVIASKTGGPKETVASGVTGILCEDTAEAFAKHMAELVHSPHKLVEMGKAGHERVLELFSFESFTERLNTSIISLFNEQEMKS